MPPEELLVENRIGREQKYFDQKAAALTDEDLVIPPRRVARYRHARLGPLNIPLDALFAHLQPSEGKNLLDYGCGHGENAVLAAACGARVTGFDLSPLSIAKARKRAELNGVAERVHFDVRTAGQTGYALASFDIVFGVGILHHLHTLLPTIYEEIAGLLRPGGAAYFVEPVANSWLLRALRRTVPVQRNATEDERQLTYQDLKPMQAHFSSLQILHFYCLERLHRIMGPNVRPRLRWLDAHVQRLLPFLRRYYGEVLIIARR